MEYWLNFQPLIYLKQNREVRLLAGFCFKNVVKFLGYLPLLASGFGCDLIPAKLNQGKSTRSKVQTKGQKNSTSRDGPVIREQGRNLDKSTKGLQSSPSQVKKKEGKNNDVDWMYNVEKGKKGKLKFDSKSPKSKYSTRKGQQEVQKKGKELSHARSRARLYKQEMVLHADSAVCTIVPSSFDFPQRQKEMVQPPMTRREEELLTETMGNLSLHDLEIVKRITFLSQSEQDKIIKSAIKQRDKCGMKYQKFEAQNSWNDFVKPFIRSRRKHQTMLEKTVYYIQKYERQLEIIGFTGLTFYYWLRDPSELISPSYIALALMIAKKCDEKELELLQNLKKSIGEGLGRTFNRFHGQAFRSQEQVFTSLTPRLISVLAGILSLTGRAVTAKDLTSAGVMNYMKNFRNNFSDAQVFIEWILAILGECYDCLRSIFPELNCLKSIPQVKDVSDWVARAHNFTSKRLAGKIPNDRVEYEQLVKLIDDGDSLMRKFVGSSMYQEVRREMVPEYVKLLQFKQEFGSAFINNSDVRMVPLAYLLRGPSGIGKSTINAAIYSDVYTQVCPESAIDSWVNEPGEHVYQRRPQQEFWDGYNGQPITVLDDFMQSRDAQGDKDSEAINLIHIVNGAPYALHMAKVEAKGTTYYAGKIVAATTNQLNENNLRSIVEPSAITRRFDLDVEVKLPQEYYTQRTSSQWGYVGNPAKIATLSGYDEFRFLVRNQNHPCSGMELTYDEFVAELVKAYKKKRDFANDQYCVQRDIIQKQYQKRFPEKFEKQFAFSPDVINSTIAYWRYQGYLQAMLYVISLILYCGGANYIAATMDWWYGDVGKSWSNYVDDQNTYFNFLFMEYIRQFFEIMGGDSLEGTIFFLLAWWNCYLFGTGNMISLAFSEAGLSRAVGQNVWQWVTFPFQPEASLVPSITRSWENIQIYFVMGFRIVSVYFVPWWIGSALSLYRMGYCIVSGQWNQYRNWRDKFAFLFSLGNEAWFVVPDLFAQITLTGVQAVDYAWINIANTCLDFLCGTSHLKVSRTLLHAFIEFQANYQRVKEFVDSNEWLSFLVYCGTVALKGAAVALLANWIFGRFFEKKESDQSFQEVAVGGISSKLHDATASIIEGIRTRVQTVPEVEGNDVVGQKFEPQGDQDGKIILKHPEWDHNADQVMRTVWEKNLFLLAKKDGEDFRVVGYLLFIEGPFAIMNYHFIEMFQHVNVKWRIYGLGGNGFCADLDATDFRCPEGAGDEVNDIAVVQLPANKIGGLRKSIVGCLPPNQKFFEKASSYETAYCVGTRNPDDKPYVYIRRARLYQGPSHMKGIGRFFEVDIQGKIGRCGLPLFVWDSTQNRHKLIGIHAAGSIEPQCKSILCALIDQATFERLRLAHHGGFSGESKSVSYVKQSAPFIHVGKYPKPVGSAGVSKIRKTSLYGEWYTPTKDIAKLKPFWSGSERIDPFVLHMMKRGDLVSPPPAWQVEQALEEVFEYIFSAIDPTKAEYKRLLSFQEAVCGIVGEPAMGSLNMVSSPGLPWCQNNKIGHSKKAIFPEKNGKYNINTVFAREVQEAVDRLVDDCAVGIRSPPILTGSLKDEKLPIAKVRAGKTRVYNASPVHEVIADKMYNCGFCRMLYDFKIYNGICIGINPYSGEWHRLAVYLNAFQNSKLIMYDVSGFDLHQFGIVHEMISDKISDWYCGSVRERQVRRMLGLIYSSFYMVYFDDIWYITTSMPSGCYQTAVRNSIYNLWSGVYVWNEFHHWASNAPKYFEHVRPADYGDDGVHCIDEYAQTVYANDEYLVSLYEKLGLKLTSPKKDSSQVFVTVSLEEASFLKRGFRYEPLVNRYVAPLDLDTVLQLPYFTKKGDDGSILDANIRLCLQELSLHGEDVWNEWYPRIQKSCSKIGKSISMSWRSALRQCCSLQPTYYETTALPLSDEEDI